MSFRREKIESNTESIVWCSRKYVQAMFFTRASRAKNITCWKINKDQSCFGFNEICREQSLHISISCSW